jgi:hypothetical protein
MSLLTPSHSCHSTTSVPHQGGGVKSEINVSSGRDSLIPELITFALQMPWRGRKGGKEEGGKPKKGKLGWHWQGTLAINSLVKMNSQNVGGWCAYAGRTGGGMSHSRGILEGRAKPALQRKVLIVLNPNAKRDEMARTPAWACFRLPQQENLKEDSGRQGKIACQTVPTRDLAPCPAQGPVCFRTQSGTAPLFQAYSNSTNVPSGQLHNLFTWRLRAEGCMGCRENQTGQQGPKTNRIRMAMHLSEPHPRVEHDLGGTPK